MNEADRAGPLAGRPGTTDGTSGLPAPSGTSSAKAGIEPIATDIHAYIGARLRKAFDDVASQPVPDRFLQLMQQLDKGTA